MKIIITQIVLDLDTPMSESPSPNPSGSPPRKGMDLANLLLELFPVESMEKPHRKPGEIDSYGAIFKV